ncbi:MAG: UDP-3-O-(3-hydroxymyristoyl)glucosamine N-acyltransferase [Wolinella sp.]
MKLREIIEFLGLSAGDSVMLDIEITAINSLEKAGAGELSFLEQDRYVALLGETRASAVLVREPHMKFLPSGCIAINSKNPYLDMARLSKLFAKLPFGLSQEPAEIDDSVQIAPSATISNGVRIGARTIIMPGAVIGEGVEIGEECLIYPNVVIYRDTRIGNRVVIHAGSVIGSDGFGYAHTSAGEHIKIYHNGIAVIEDDVELGANNCIDRAVFGETRIKRGSKIDNLVQIAHNCVLGEHSIVVSQVGLAGSTTTGRNVVFGGQSATSGHLHIGDFATIAARGGVTKNIDGNKTYAGFPLFEHREWLKIQGIIKGLLKKANRM